MQIETLVLEMLLIVSVVAIVVRRFRIPYPVALVLVGVALSFRSPLEVALTPELIRSRRIPPLVFDGPSRGCGGACRRRATMRAGASRPS